MSLVKTVSGSQQLNLNTSAQIERKNFVRSDTALSQATAPNTTRLGERNFSANYLKNKLQNLDANRSISTAPADTIRTLGGSGAPPSGLNFEESKSISDIAYEGNQGEVYQFPDGSYWRVDRAQVEDSGFRAVAMRQVVPDGNGGYVDNPNDNRVAIGFAGTNGIDDINDDFLQGVGFTPEQYDQAVAFTNEIRQEAAVNCEPVTVTGHSLGGGLATYVSIQTGVPATAINSAPLSDNKIPDDVNFDSQITQYYTEGEILTDLDNANPLDARPGRHVQVEGVIDEQATLDEISWWQHLLPGYTAGVSIAISVENHQLGNTAPEVAAPTKVYP